MVKISPCQVAEDHRLLGCRGSHIILAVGAQTAVKWSSSPAGIALTPGRLPAHISVTGGVYPRDRSRLEGLGKLKYPGTSSGPSGLQHSASIHYAAAPPLPSPTGCGRNMSLRFNVELDSDHCCDFLTVEKK
jgi:hypothetical protein